MIAERSFAGETPVVDLENVSLTYEGSDKPSLVNINLKIYEGEFICVLGPSAWPVFINHWKETRGLMVRQSMARIISAGLYFSSLRFIHG